jgi:hypothetical protein
MSKKHPGKQIVKESFKGPSGSCGYETTMWRQKGREQGGALVLLRGGLGDRNTVSLVPLAHAIIEASDGEFIVGTAIGGAIKARNQRSMSYLGAARRMRDVYEPDAFVAGGQSEGGVTVADAMLHWHTKAKRPGRIPKAGVVTMNTPAIFEPMPTEGNLISELWRLGGNCLKDIRQVSREGWLEMLEHQMEHGISLWEPAFIIGEVVYLRDNLDISPVVEDLRSINVAVKHVFQREDSVSGAEFADEHSVVHNGAHVRVMWQPEPAAEFIVGITMELMDSGARFEAVPVENYELLPVLQPTG